MELNQGYPDIFQLLNFQENKLVNGSGSQGSDQEDAYSPINGSPPQQERQPFNSSELDQILGEDNFANPSPQLEEALMEAVFGQGADGNNDNEAAVDLDELLNRLEGQIEEQEERDSQEEEEANVTPEEEEEEEEEEGEDSTTDASSSSSPLCRVCQAPAGKHTYYGGKVCSGKVCPGIHLILI